MKINQTKKVTLVEWNTFLNNMNNLEFWNKPTHVNCQGVDGAQWILEGYKDGKYHFLNRWSPEHCDNSQFVSICNSLEELFEEINNETDTE